MISNKLIFSNILVLLLIISSAIISNSFAVFLFALFIYIVGNILSLSIDKKNRAEGVFLFDIVLSFLMVFASIHYLHTQVNYNDFALEWKDEYKFWLMSQELSNIGSIKGIFRQVFYTWGYGDLPGYAFYIGVIGCLADTYLDGNNLFLQFLGTVLWGSFSSRHCPEFCVNDN